MMEFVTLAFDPDDEQEIAFEPLPNAVDEYTYLDAVRQLPAPTPGQIAGFLDFVVGAKSWYKHLPTLPPGDSMSFFLNVNAGLDRLRRYGAEVVYRERTHSTPPLHYTWMTTAEYRHRFGYLSFCCRAGTEFYSEEELEDGAATLDPNFSHAFIEGEPGVLALAPATVLNAGTCHLTRILDERTEAPGFARQWNRQRSGQDSDWSPEESGEHWGHIALLCEQIGAVTTAAAAKAEVTHRPAGKKPSAKLVRLQDELNSLLKTQRAAERSAMRGALETMLDYIDRAGRTPH